MAYPIVPRGERALVNFLYEAPHKLSRWGSSQGVFQRRVGVVAALAVCALALLCALAIARSLRGRVTPPPKKEPAADALVPKRDPVEGSSASAAADSEAASGDDCSSYVQALNTQLDELFNDIQAETRDALIGNIESSRWKDEPKVVSVKRVLDYLKANDIDERKKGALGQEWRYRFDNELRTIPVPSDGNCLFHASRALLQLFDKGNLVAEDLRRRVADWIDQEYKKAAQEGVQEQGPDCENPGILDHLRASMESYEAVRRRDLNGELESLQAQESMGENVSDITAARETIDAQLRSLNELTREGYVALCRQDKFHGGPVEIYAISQLFNVNIEIERLYVTYAGGQGVSSRRIRGFDRSYGSGFDTTITLVNVGGDHYDADLPA